MCVTLSKDCKGQPTLFPLFEFMFLIIWPTNVFFKIFPSKSSCKGKDICEMLLRFVIILFSADTWKFIFIKINLTYKNKTFYYAIFSISMLWVKVLGIMIYFLCINVFKFTLLIIKTLKHKIKSHYNSELPLWQRRRKDYRDDLDRHFAFSLLFLKQQNP